MLLAESTFDPNLAFRLSKPFRNTLFEASAQTEALGPLRVNAAGGGTWISEFESLVGLDVRMFGYWGYYTHSFLAPHVKESFPRYLKRKGYSTAAYYPISGRFYHAKSAYKHYGFDRFVDSAQMDLSGKWNVSDEQVVDAVIANSDWITEAPFFKYVLTVANHAPHPCKNFSDFERQQVQFESAAHGDPRNCILNEYAYETLLTGHAFWRLVSYLDKIEEETGRPFVALSFGDHQPHTFTTDAYSNKYKYDEFRTELSEYHTFLHLVSSIRGVVRLNKDIPPSASLLPTILSSYIAAEPNALYLGQNWYQYDRCGSEISMKCPIYEELLVAFRNANIIE